ncbi:transcription elongation factor TFIIS [Rhodamnia argentea]|uniref:Transcription elongation factor n=1 Tax=Rhodamnia argentea TaxID=178133 RepID=A0A8B8QBL8_9MYRT|nr:transcription elongation factor TFIIS [Rhodamnia argentea]
MDRELVELFERAKKAADAAASDGVSSDDPEVSRCVDALKRLKGFPVSYDALVATQVGKRLRHLTKHPTETIKTMAADVLEIWKKIIIDETAKNKKKSSSDDKLLQKNEKADSIKFEKGQKAGAVKVDKSSHVETVKVEKIYKGDSTKLVSSSQTTKVEKNVVDTLTLMSEKNDREVKEEKQPLNTKKPLAGSNAPPKLTGLVKCNDSLRDKVRELLVEALSKVVSEADDDIKNEVNACDPIRVAVTVESLMFEKMGRSNGTQKFKYRSIMFNIKDPNNPDLRRKVLLGEVKPERLITMTPDEMASDQRQLENHQIKEKALFDCERGGPPKATTDQFKCGRCGQRKTTYYQLQTRSADEPMTTFVTCVNCNNHWKFC